MAPGGRDLWEIFMFLGGFVMMENSEAKSYHKFISAP